MGMGNTDGRTEQAQCQQQNKKKVSASRVRHNEATLIQIILICNYLTAI